MTNGSRKPRIYADFQNNDAAGRIRLNCVGTIASLSRSGIVLREGLEAVIYCSELETDGVVRFSESERLWVAEIDLHKIRDRSPDPSLQTFPNPQFGSTTGT